MEIQTRYGHDKFIVMSFGLMNAPKTIIDPTNWEFKNYLDSFVIFFIEKIFVYSKNKGEHMDQSRVVLQIINEQQLFSKYSKC